MEKNIDDSYNSLIAKLKSHSIDEEDLIKVKKIFEQEIDSPRRLLLTVSFANLIDLLENRQLVHSHNIRRIKQILEVYEINGIRQLIINHSNLLIEYNYTHVAVEYQADKTSLEEVISNHQIPSQVIEIISNQIGDSWIEMAYQLKFKAGEIDSIEESSNNSVIKSLEILKRYDAGSQDCKRGRLINALTNLRRKLLRDEVEKLLMLSCINCRSFLPN